KLKLLEFLLAFFTIWPQHPQAAFRSRTYRNIGLRPAIPPTADYLRIGSAACAAVGEIVLVVPGMLSGFVFAGVIAATALPVLADVVQRNDSPAASGVTQSSG